MFSCVKQKILLWGQKRIEKGAWFLAPLSFVWGFVSFWKNVFYDRGWRKVLKVNCPVVSVGNLVAGGTGKTPLVHLLASRFSHLPVAILSRGYGKVPDEPLLLQRRLKNAKVYIGKDRCMLAQKAESEGARLILLDDGFQYRRLHRDFDLVLLAGSDPFGKGHYLPWGFLRDHPRRLASADTIFISGGQTSLYPAPHVHLEVNVDRILDMQQTVVSSIKDSKVAIFCGIAKPHLFKKTVEGLGAEVVLEWVLGDHEMVSSSRLQQFVLEAKNHGAEMLVCTEKDYVKLDPSRDFPLPIVFLEISLVVRNGFSLWENLIAKITQKIDNQS
jgi:tetraacyldisaccharide 4'-kinase